MSTAKKTAALKTYLNAAKSKTVSAAQNDEVLAAWDKA